jgi:hypothetical protein
VFTRTRQLFLSLASSVLSKPTHNISLRSILIDSSQLCLGLPSGDYPRFSHQGVCHLPQASHFSCQYHPPWLGHPDSWWRVKIMKIIIIQFSSVSCYFPLLRRNVFLSHSFQNNVSFKHNLHSRTRSPEMNNQILHTSV